MTLNLPFTASADELLQKISCFGSRSDFKDVFFDNNQGRFISCKINGNLVALCIHKTKNHDVFVEVHNGITSIFGASDKIIRSNNGRAFAGQWCYAKIEAGKLGGNKAYYKCY